MKEKKIAEKEKKPTTKRKIPEAVRKGLREYLLRSRLGAEPGGGALDTPKANGSAGPGRGNSNKTEPCAQCEKPKPYQRKDKLCSDCRTEMIGDSVYQYDIENLPGGGDSGVASYAERYRDEYG